MEVFCWLITLIALIGAYFNSKQNKIGFYFWIVSNVSFCIVNLIIGQFAQSFLFFAYLIISIYGLVVWSKK